MIKPEFVVVQKYSFECEVSPVDLTDLQLKELDLSPDVPADLEYMLKAEGSFRIEWDDDIPTPILETFVIDSGNKFISVPDYQIDLNTLISDIESFESADWYEDRLSQLIDAAESKEDR